MAHITNNSQQALSVVLPLKIEDEIIVSPGFNAFLTPRHDSKDQIDPASETDMPDDLAKQWANKGMVDYRIRQGHITIAYGDIVTDVDVSHLTDPDEIEAMFAETDDPKLQDALEQRMKEIS